MLSKESLETCFFGDVGASAAGAVGSMNIWGYSEQALEEVAVADAVVIQRFESLIVKLVQAAERDELSLQ